MIRDLEARAPLIGKAIRVAAFIAAGAILAGCVSIPQRAWANGRAMSQSLEYQRVMSGDMSFSTHRALQDRLNPRLINSMEVAYPAFPTFGGLGSTWPY